MPTLRLTLAVVVAIVVLPPLCSQEVDLASEPLRGLRAEIATLLVEGIEGGSLPLAVQIRPEVALEAGANSEGVFSLPLTLEIPGAPILSADEQAEKLAIEIYVYALDPSGAVMAHLSERIEIELVEFGDALFATGLRFHGRLELRSGRYSLRFLVVEPVSRRFAGAIREVALAPPEEPDSFALSPPRFALSCPSWITASQDGAAPGRSTALAVLRAGGIVRLSSFLLGGAENTDLVEMTGASVSVELRSVSAAEVSASVQGVPVELEEWSRLAPDVLRFDIGLQLADLPQGRYQISLTIAAAEGHWTSQPEQVWILGEQSAAARRHGESCEPSWAEVLRLAQAEELPSGDTDVAEELTTGRRRRVEKAYRRVLAEVAARGDLRAAAVGLGEVEAGLIDANLETFSILRRAELAVAAQLWKVEHETLPALLMLHQNAYLEHFENKRFGLATHSREMTMALVELFGDSLGDERNSRLVAGVLTSLAEHATRRRVTGPSQELLERALELDPRHEEALLLLACNYEKLGRYTSAISQLERLVDVNAKSMEARVRLGILLERTGDLRRSEIELRRVLRERVAGWLRSLAYQTLGRVLVKLERFDEAVEILTEAVERLPGQQRLGIQLAYSMDRVGRSREAAELLAELAPTGEEGRSPRLRYSEPSATVLDPLRELLGQAIAVRLPLLSVALERSGEEPRS